MKEEEKEKEKEKEKEGKSDRVSELKKDYAVSICPTSACLQFQSSNYVIVCCCLSTRTVLILYCRMVYIGEWITYSRNILKE